MRGVKCWAETIITKPLWVPLGPPNNHVQAFNLQDGGFVSDALQRSNKDSDINPSKDGEVKSS